jgi:hypothetical protein
MRNALLLLSGLTVAGGLAVAVASSAQAAPAQTALPALQSYAGSDVVVQARRRCWRTCVRRRMGVCYRWRRNCR